MLLPDNNFEYTTVEDNLFIKELLKYSTIRIFGQKYPGIDLSGPKLAYNGTFIDTFYLRNMFFESEFYKNIDFLNNLSSSNALIFDHPSTITLEEKDLSFLTQRDPKLSRYMVTIIRHSEIDSSTMHQYVKKD